MSYPVFIATVEDAFLDEEVNARGELSARQHDAVMEEAHGNPVDLTLRRVDGIALGYAVLPQRVLVVGTTGIPVRQGLTLLMGDYVCFVTKRPELVVGIARPELAPREIVERYRKVLLRAQKVTEADLAANELGVRSRSQRGRTTYLTVMAGGALLLTLGLFLRLQVQLGWDPLALCANVFFDPPCLFGSYWLIRNWFRLRHAPVLVMDGKVTSRKLRTRTKVSRVAIRDFEVWPGEDEVVEWVLPGLPYRLYWTADPRQPRKSSTPLPSQTQVPYRSGPEGDADPARRPKVLSFLAIDLSEQPLAR
jgi:hypothetical protein